MRDIWLADGKLFWAYQQFWHGPELEVSLYHESALYKTVKNERTMDSKTFYRINAMHVFSTQEVWYTLFDSTHTIAGYSVPTLNIV